MVQLGLSTDVVDADVLERAVAHLAAGQVLLPTFAQLADPTTIPKTVRQRLHAVDPDAADAANLFRVHWYNDAKRRQLVEVPEHLSLPSSLTGVPSPILVALGNRFPMIAAHKVLAAYACLAPRIATGQFDPTAHRALWPSTGNYCRGGVAISRIMGCRGVAILPAGMSRERFGWLEQWVQDAGDIVRTPGTESNVKEIYDKCAELSAADDAVVFNQFCEYGNHLVHYQATGRALGRIFEHHRTNRSQARLAAFVSATGSAGTIGAGDHLKEAYGSEIVAVEALECPTMLRNGFGEHNIQGIGDKHIPLIHNVMNTDAIVGVSDQSTDALGLLFNTDAGKRQLEDRAGVPAALVAELRNLGLSSICNVLAAIAYAEHHGLGEDDVVVTVATDGAEMYGSEREKTLRDAFRGRFEAADAAATLAEHLRGRGHVELLDLSHRDRERIFNLGYFTWVEQQGLDIQDFAARRQQAFWREMRAKIALWDQRIVDFNRRSGLAEAS